MPSEPALGMKPDVVLTRPKWQNDGAWRFRLATPCAAVGRRAGQVAVQPFGDAAFKCSGLGLNAAQPAVMLQKARTFVKARWPVFRGPIGSVTRCARVAGVKSPFPVFSRFSNF